MTAEAIHRENARKHAIRRCRERHNVELRPADLDNMEDRIRSGDAVVLRLEPDGKRVVRVRMLFDHLIVVFDPTLDCVVTVLADDCREGRVDRAREGQHRERMKS